MKPKRSKCTIVCETHELYPYDMFGKKFGMYRVESLTVFINKRKHKHVLVSCPHRSAYLALARLERGVIGCHSCRLVSENKPVFDEVTRRLNVIHRGMIRRCTDPKIISYPRYKDVEIFEPWKTDRFAFIQYMLTLPDYGPKMTMDRIDNNKGYVPGNIRWASITEQNYNRKNTIQVLWNGEELSLRRFTIKYCKASEETIRTYYHKGMPVDELVNLDFNRE